MFRRIIQNLTISDMILIELVTIALVVHLIRG
jgi:hypothetical protein